MKAHYSVTKFQSFKDRQELEKPGYFLVVDKIPR